MAETDWHIQCLIEHRARDEAAAHRHAEAELAPLQAELARLRGSTRPE